VTLIAACIALLVTVLFMLALRPLALSIDMVDRPGGHKSHVGDVPIIGGIAMYIGAAIGLILLSDLDPRSYFLLLAGGMLVFIGLLDDKFSLAASIRIVAQLAAVLIMVFGAGLIMRDIGDPLWMGTIRLGFLALPITALMFITVINAFNLVDGVDGLAGSLAIIALFGITGVADIGSPAFAIAAVFIAVVSGYLVFNFPVGNKRPYRAFMGDSGSTFIGLAIVWLTVSICQGSTRQISPVTGLWFAALPLYDLFTCFCRRIAEGGSPFQSGADHFHHALLRSGMTVREVVGTLAMLQLLYVGFAIATHLVGVSDPIVFTVWAVVGIGQFLVIRGCAAIFRRRHESRPARA
jgi:UDP-GlcNAc:undecaprenyl-phosphate GlcNAc-1-phosphate transferase